MFKWDVKRHHQFWSQNDISSGSLNPLTIAILAIYLVKNTIPVDSKFTYVSKTMLIRWQKQKQKNRKQGRRHLVTVFCGDTARWFTAKCILRWTFSMNRMSNRTCSDRPSPTCKTCIVVTATIFTLFKANTHIRGGAAECRVTSFVVAAAGRHFVYWLWIRYIS